MSVLQGTAVNQPETWFNYAVPSVPTSMHRLLGGSTMNTAELVAEEAEAQTKVRPVSCRPSRHGANPQTGRITWIVSFLAPVRPFRLFNASELSNLIKRKVLITRHDPGCQGYCNPIRCNRHTRCGTCSSRIDQHDGPGGVNCTQKAKCANCWGPFPAGHEHCPAIPQRKDGKVIQLTKAQLKTIRRHGERNFQAANLPSSATRAETLSPQPASPMASITVERSKRKRGAIVTAHEEAGSQNRIPDTQLADSHLSLPQPMSSRSKRGTATNESLSLAEIATRSLVASSLRDMEIDNSNTSC